MVFSILEEEILRMIQAFRHLDVAIEDPRPAAGSFNMVDVRRLRCRRKWYGGGLNCFVLYLLAFVACIYYCFFFFAFMVIHDFLCLRKWTGVEVQDEPHLDARSTLQRLPFYRTPAAAADVFISDPTPKDLVAGHVAKRTSSALAQLSGSTTRPNLFVGDSDDESDGDDDTCVEIPLVTRFRSTAVTPSSGNQGRSSAVPTAKGSNTRDSQGKGIMVNDDVVPSGGASRPRPAFEPTPSFKDVSGDAIHTDFFVSLLVHIMPHIPKVLTKEVFKDPTVCKTIVDQFPTPGEMVRVESLSDDQLAAKMSVLHCMMMSYGGELLARYRGLNQSHHEYVLSADSRLKCYGVKSKAKGKEMKKKIKSLTKTLDNLHSEVARLSDLVRKFPASDEFSRVQGELKMVNFMPGAQYRLVEASPLIAQTDYDFVNKISGYATEPLSVILQLEPEKLVHPANIPIPRGTRISPPIAKESTVTLVFESLELFASVNFTASDIASEHNKEMVNTNVDGSNPKITDDTTAVKFGHAFVQGISVALDDVTVLVEVGSGLVPSGPDDVVVALSAHKKGEGLDSSSAVVEEADVNPSGFRLSFFFLPSFFVSLFSVREGRVVWRRTLVAPNLGQTECRCVVVHPADLESGQPP
nr:hypothetical protein [Tanacetum cinerariifolium]